MMKLPLKGSKEYKMLVTLTGFAIGLVWVAKDEYENPKWTGIPKAATLSVDEIGQWNKQFGPSDVNKWAISAKENEEALHALSEKQLGDQQEPPPTVKKDTW